MSDEKNRDGNSWISAINSGGSRVIPFILLGFMLLAATAAHGQKSAGSNAPTAEQPGAAVRAFPQVDLGAGRRLEYVGTFSPDGKFKPLTKFGLFVDSMKSASLSGQPTFTSAPPGPVKGNEEDLSKQVPPNIELQRNERLVEDFQPPEHAVKVAKGNSVVVELRDSIVSLVYGPEKVMMAPQSVTTDSRQRVIVTDAAAHGLHVLAYAAKDSFQIVGGPGRRLQSPNGVAVDSNDNIYVSDSERGTVLVYDWEGRFVRTIGSFGDEGLFERPTGIAIDCKAGHLYILDPPRHILFILDLEGKVLARVGTIAGAGTGFSSRIGSTEPGTFEAPKAVLVHNDELIVLDGRRVRILDLQGKFLKEFRILSSDGQPASPAPGLFVDAKNRIYVSDPGGGIVRVYNHDGQFLLSFGRPGNRIGEFNAPAGMWADSTGRLYIVDANNRRIQVFQFSGPN
jgi:DNA-binding beta-propeller fold protein YncE